MGDETRQVRKTRWFNWFSNRVYTTSRLQAYVGRIVSQIEEIFVQKNNATLLQTTYVGRIVSQIEEIFVQKNNATLLQTTYVGRIVQIEEISVQKNKAGNHRVTDAAFYRYALSITCFDAKKMQNQRHQISISKDYQLKYHHPIIFATWTIALFLRTFCPFRAQQ